jgi:hypothetical protein
MKNIVLSILLMFGFCTLASADIFNPLPEQPHKAFLASVNGGSALSGNLLADATAIINYLGVKEGEAYNFNQHKWVTTTGATLISYTPWNLALDIQMLNADGVVGSIAWNIGNYLPVQNVPVMQYTQYLYLYGGAGAEQKQEADGSSPMKFASVAGAEFKFTF